MKGGRDEELILRDIREAWALGTVVPSKHERCSEAGCGGYVVLTPYSQREIREYDGLRMICVNNTIVTLYFV